MLRFIFILSVTALLVAIFIMLFGRIVPEPPSETSARDFHTEILQAEQSGLSTVSFLARFGGWIGYNASSVSASPLPVDAETAPATVSDREITGISLFSEDFSAQTLTDESLTETASSNPHWWISSGGSLLLADGVGETISGTLTASDARYKLYASGLRADLADGGSHPQNAFRAVQRGEWQDVSQEMYFNVQRVIYSDHEQRGATNGVFLMSRYLDADNLYFAGIRVDGTVAIMKKKNGLYHTLLSAKLYDGLYDVSSDTVLLPLDQWIGLRLTTENTDNGNVDLILSVDRERTDSWEIIGSTTDDGVKYDGDIFSEAGHTGIMSDFMDVQFDDYLIRPIDR